MVSRDPEWLITQCYYLECASGRIKIPTLGTAEPLVEAEFGVVSIVTDQVHECCSIQVMVRDASPCPEGTEP